MKVQLHRKGGEEVLKLCQGTRVPSSRLLPLQRASVSYMNLTLGSETSCLRKFFVKYLVSLTPKSTHAGPATMNNIF